MQNPKAYYTSRGIALRLGLHHATVNLWWHKGHMPAPANTTPGGIKRWTPAQVDEIEAAYVPNFGLTLHAGGWNE